MSGPVVVVGLMIAVLLIHLACERYEARRRARLRREEAERMDWLGRERLP